MPRPCSVCKHPRVADLERELARGGTFRGLAKVYGVDEKSIRRHQAKQHLGKARESWGRRETPRTGVAPIEDLPDLQAIGGLKEQAQHLRRILLAVLRRYGGGSDMKGLAAIAGQAMRTLEFEARLDGLFGAGPWTPGDGADADPNGAAAPPAPEQMTFHVHLSVGAAPQVTSV
jgi:hypothetical protein